MSNQSYYDCLMRGQQPSLGQRLSGLCDSGGLYSQLVGIPTPSKKTFIDELQDEIDEWLKGVL